MLELDFSTQAIKFLKKISGKPAKQIKKKIQEMCENPYPQDSSKLVGYIFYRVDCGEYRIIYRVNGNTLEIRIVGKRNDDEAYKILKRSKL
ncbi:MAG: type II toxin-antitoxin system RelE family toxin [Pseudobdellovibrionaceae bacterium]